MTYTIFTLSPGSTSTKLAVFKDHEQVFKTNVTHDPEKLKEFKEAKEQFNYRKETILEELKQAGIDLAEVDAYAAYSGGLEPAESGIYPVNEKILEDTLSGKINHPAILGAKLIHDLAEPYGKDCYLVNPPDSDEFEDLARVTGLKGVYRQCRVHVLNQKEVAIRYANEIGKKYEEGNFIVAHVGGGLSVTCQKHGKIIDGNDVLNGAGPMAPNRSGTLPAMDVVKMCFSGEYTEKDMKALIGKTGGLINHLGTSDAREVTGMAKEGNKAAERVWKSMLYQVVKYIGSMATALHGEVDGILLGGGMVYDESLVQAIKDGCEWIAPVYPYPGEFEMEAMAAGPTRALDGVEKTKEYTGIPSWTGFED